MELDIKTLSFTLLLTFFIQAMAFYLMTIAIRKYKGTDLWALGGLSIALGHGFIFLRGLHTNHDGLLIIASNFFQIGGVLLFYIGSKLFFNFQKKNSLLISAFALFLLVIGYYTFIDDQLRFRIIAFSAFMAALSFPIAWIFVNHNKSSYKKSSIFVAFIFIINGIFFTYRIFYYLYNDKPIDFFSMDIMQSMTLLLCISLGLLWTFGIIIVVNHRLNGELTETKNIFELIFNTIPDAITIIDKQTFQYINTNPSFTRLTGYTKEEALVNGNISSQICKDPKVHLRLKEELKEKGFCNNQEVTVQQKNGMEIVGLLSTTQIKLKEKDCILTIGRDVTELKQKNQEIDRKTQQLEKLVAEKDKFFSILAHDLRGPIAAAISLTELMTDKSYDFSKNELLKLAHSLNKSACSTNELLENLLEWTGLHRGINAFKPNQIRFSDLMAPFFSYLMDTARNKQIVLKNEIPGDTLLFADSHMIQTVFRNLIINAIKFTHTGGNIRLSVQDHGNGQTTFSVADSGIGMSEETLDTLFHIDFSNNRSGTNGEPSSGLGLLLCKEFVERHGGNIWAESEPGKGSIFSFRLGNE